MLRNGGDIWIYHLITTWVCYLSFARKGQVFQDLGFRVTSVGHTCAPVFAILGLSINSLDTSRFSWKDLGDVASRLTIGITGEQ